MQLRRGNQPKKNINMPEYEIKTYGSNIGVNRSPKTSGLNSNAIQSSGRQVYPSDSYGELPYIEQNEIQVSNIPNHKSSLNLNFNMRSPVRNIGNKENSNFNTNNNERMDMTSQVNFSKYNYNSQIPNYDTRRFIQSSKTIFLGERAPESEYNTKNMNKNRSPIYQGKEKDEQSKKFTRMKVIWSFS